MTTSRLPPDIKLILPVLMSVCVLAGSICGAEEKVGASRSADSDAEFSFCVYGDTRSNHEPHRKVVNQIVALAPDFTILMGDMVAHGNEPREWEKFFEIEAPVLESTVFYPVRGNHDGKAEIFEKQFVLPEGTTGTQLYYSFNKGECHFVVLDTCQSLWRGSPQHNWLSRDLNENRQRYTFVFMHHAMFSARIRKGKIMPNNQPLINALHDVFVRNSVTAVWSGHVHNYYRTRRDGVTYVCAAGGGATLYDVAEAKLLPGDKAFADYHVVNAEVTGEGVRCTVHDVSGNIKDRFTLPDVWE